ncbi:putative late blight resistance protein homolog R1B-16 [Salvia hispanica]|uniref:putative late blight resistance protein homolog R1B-16 n=1 Tax=Salvia hispanica TaxID=49212 RepID=UPI002008FB1E|nr:putative late blight resistance protein homolog R1B-16 [Salvia hispanica]XP_047954068.1 putative late blight resistance protein homolog R1B-16 [Salvia hispanica]
MAAYAALVSLMHLIDTIELHHFPFISLHKHQIQSLTEIVTFLLEFLQAYNSPVSDRDKADPLEMRIADAAYAAEDAIESHIVHKIQLSESSIATKPRQSFYSRFRGLKLRQDVQNVIKELDRIKRVAMETNTKKMVVFRDQPRRSASSSTGNKSSGTMVLPDHVLYGIMEKLVVDEPGRQVITITGMGGIGKTALAQTVYSKQVIKERFDIRAWATISEHYNTREILCELVSQTTNQKKEKLSERSEAELGLELHKYLFGIRFLIVMDDMWNIESWNEIQHFFPNNGNSSHIMVTTRLSHLGSQLNNHYSHQMEFLDEVNSWVLFSKIVFGDEPFPLELEKIGKEIAYNCRGLPLSIVVVGGNLKNMEPTQECWESIRKNLTSIVNSNNDKHCLRLLKMSYNHLPVYLKPCFLHMGMFGEDAAIKVSTLIQLWVRGRFLKPKDGKSLEAIGKGFLKDLVHRNLILVDELGSTGNIKQVKVHDLLRDLCLNQGEKEGFYHRNTSQEKLQHLNVEDGFSSSNFPSFSHLWNLQKLTVSCSWATLNEIWKIPQLRHLDVVATRLLLPESPGDFVVMRNLVVVEGAINFKCDEEMIKRIPNIMKLRIKYLESMEMRNNDYYCLSNIKHFCKLESLDILCGYQFRGNVSLCKLTFPPTLKSLKLVMSDDFEWEIMLERIGSLPLLEKLKLRYGRFGTCKWKIFEGQFSCLKYLELSSCHSLKHWTTEAGSIFPRLEKLTLLSLKGLENMPYEIGDIPTLQKILMSGCRKSVVKCAKDIVEEQMDCQGDNLPFHVFVRPSPLDDNKAMQNFAGPNFVVAE